MLGCLAEGLQTLWAGRHPDERSCSCGGLFPRPCVDLLCVAVSFNPSLICLTDSNVFLT